MTDDSNREFDTNLELATNLVNSVKKSEELSQAREIYESKHEKYINDVDFLIKSWSREVDINPFL